MREVTKEELLGYCEARSLNDEKASSLKVQIKALNTDSSELTKETALDFDTKPKHLNEIYKKYKEYQSGETDDDDFYSLVSLLAETLEKKE